MQKIIISDTSCLIALERIDQLKILNDIFPKVVTTREVRDEFGRNLPEWIDIVPVKNRSLQNHLEDKLDLGESSAIALALELENSVLIIDEKKGRSVARSYKIPIIGTLKVLIIAKKRGVIPSVKEQILTLDQHGFRFSSAVIKEVLQEAGE